MRKHLWLLGPAIAAIVATVTLDAVWPLSSGLALVRSLATGATVGVLYAAIRWQLSEDE